jgi:hypothetical protein
MADQITVPRVEDFVSVGSRISWGAIFAGALLALGLYSLLTFLGGAVGLSISDRVRPTTLKNTAIAWALLTLVVSVFVGGVVASQFTVGETKMEALLYGVIMWALLFGFLATLSALGVRSGFHAMAGVTDSAQAGRNNVNAQTQPRNAAEDTTNEEATKEALTRLTWYAFIGTWVSMIAAAVGACVGAGPRFKIVAVRTSNRVVM